MQVTMTTLAILAFLYPWALLAPGSGVEITPDSGALTFHKLGLIIPHARPFQLILPVNTTVINQHCKEARAARLSLAKMVKKYNLKHNYILALFPALDYEIFKLCRAGDVLNLAEFDKRQLASTADRNRRFAAGWLAKLAFRQALSFSQPFLKKKLGEALRKVAVPTSLALVSTILTHTLYKDDNMPVVNKRIKFASNYSSPVERALDHFDFHARRHEEFRACDAVPILINIFRTQAADAERLQDAILDARRHIFSKNMVPLQSRSEFYQTIRYAADRAGLMVPFPNLDYLLDLPCSLVIKGEVGYIFLHIPFSNLPTPFSLFRYAPSPISVSAPGSNESAVVIPLAKEQLLAFHESEVTYALDTADLHQCSHIHSLWVCSHINTQILNPRLHCLASLFLADLNAIHHNCESAIPHKLSVTAIDTNTYSVFSPQPTPYTVSCSPPQDAQPSGKVSAITRVHLSPGCDFIVGNYKLNFQDTTSFQALAQFKKLPNSSLSSWHDLPTTWIAAEQQEGAMNTSMELLWYREFHSSRDPVSSAFMTIQNVIILLLLTLTLCPVFSLGYWFFKEARASSRRSKKKTTRNVTLLDHRRPRGEATIFIRSPRGSRHSTGSLSSSPVSLRAGRRSPGSPRSPPLSPRSDRRSPGSPRTSPIPQRRIGRGRALLLSMISEARNQRRIQESRGAIRRHPGRPSSTLPEQAARMLNGGGCGRGSTRGMAQRPRSHMQESVRRARAAMADPRALEEELQALTRPEHAPSINPAAPSAPPASSPENGPSNNGPQQRAVLEQQPPPQQEPAPEDEDFFSHLLPHHQRVRRPRRQ